MKNEWIPVEKRLPKRGEFVFVVIDKEGPDTAELTNDNPVEWWGVDGTVTHWFPYPDYSEECEKKFQEQVAEWKKNRL